MALINAIRHIVVGITRCLSIRMRLSMMAMMGLPRLRGRWGSPVVVLRLVVRLREGFLGCLGKRALTMVLCQAEEEEAWRPGKSRIG